MTIRRFRVNVEGLGDLVGLLFDGGEPELDAFLTQRRVPDCPYVATTTAATSEDEHPRPVGRPSFDATIARAVAALGEALNLGSSLSARSRLVLRHLVQSGVAPELIPSSRTVECFLAKHSRGNSRNKSRRKSARATMGSTGG